MGTSNCARIRSVIPPQAVTKSALTSFSIACWANADEDVATAWLITPAFSVLVVITAKADMVPRLNALHLLLVQLLLADVAPSKQSSSQVHLSVAEASTMSRRLWSAEVPGV